MFCSQKVEGFCVCFVLTNSRILLYVLGLAVSIGIFYLFCSQKLEGFSVCFNVQN